MNATLLSAEQTLSKHSPIDFDATVDAAPESIEVVWAVEDEDAWRAGYESLSAFYAAHEARHPDVRLYGRVRRKIADADPLTSAGGTIAQRLARLLAE